MPLAYQCRPLIHVPPTRFRPTSLARCSILGYPKDNRSIVSTWYRSLLSP